MTDTIDYKGYSINIMQDSDACNPMDNDGTWNMLSRYDRRLFIHGSDNIRDPLQYFTDAQIIRHSKRICEAFGMYVTDTFGAQTVTVTDALAEHVTDYQSDYDTMADCKREFFQDMLDDISDSDLFDTLSDLYDIVKIPNLNTSTSGYVQGAYADIFIAALPEQVKEFGLTGKHDFQRDMTGQAAIYGAYLWGDCYGYNITDQDGNDIDDGSCWGFYTDSHETSGLLEMAHDAIDYQVKQSAQFTALLDGVNNMRGLGL
jgi:hypothetical protein